MGFISGLLRKISRDRGERISENDSLYFLGKKTLVSRYMFASRYARGKKVLDIACGEGLGSYTLSKHAKKVLGVDNHKDVIKRNRLKYKKKNLSFICGDAEKLRIKGTHDLIVSMETIEHLKKDKEFLKSVYTLLRKNGKMILSTPNRDFAKIFLDDTRTSSFHYREYSQDSLRKLLLKEGFRNIRLYSQGCFNKSSPYISFLYHFIRDRQKVMPLSDGLQPVSMILVAEK